MRTKVKSNLYRTAELCDSQSTSNVLDVVPCDSFGSTGEVAGLAIFIYS